MRWIQRAGCLTSPGNGHARAGRHHQRQRRHLEWDSSTGTLYGASSTPNRCFSISTVTGAATLVGSIGFTSFNYLGYESTNNVMHMTNSGTDSLYIVNRASGSVALVESLFGATHFIR